MAKKPENIMRIKSLPDGKVVEIHEDGTETPYLEPPIDWDRIDAMSDEDIAQQVMDNPDAAALPLAIDVRGIRENLGFNKKQFARLLRVPYGTLLNWEYGRNEPSGAARVLFKVLDKKPAAVFESLGLSKCALSERRDEMNLQGKENKWSEGSSSESKDASNGTLFAWLNSDVWKNMPCAELGKRGILKRYTKGTKSHELRAACKQLFDDLNLVSSNYSVAFRRGIGSKSDPKTSCNLLAWQATVLKRFQDSPPQAKFEFEHLTSDWFKSLRKLSIKDSGPLDSKNFLGDIGISLIVEKHFERTKLDGAALIYDKIPVIGITLRFDRVDNFWFVLFHELAHLKLHLSKEPRRTFFDQIDADPKEIELDKEEAENEADEFAQDALIPAGDWKNCLVKFKFSDKLLLSFASEVAVHPAIVAGRIRQERGDYSVFTKHLGQNEVRKQFAQFYSAD